MFSDLDNLTGYLLLLAGILMWLRACWYLITESGGGRFSMGEEMYFSQQWLFASLFGVAGILKLASITLWFYVPSVIVMYMLSFPVRRWLLAMLFGIGLKPDETGSGTKQATEKHADD